MSDEISEEPPILEPEPPPIQERRSYVGWICLSFVFLLMITGGLLLYFNRAAEPVNLFRQFDGELKQIFFAREVGSTFGSESSTDWKAKLRALAKDIEEESKEDPALVSILVVVNSESGIHPTNNQLYSLSKQESERSKLIATLYGSPKALRNQEIRDTNELFSGDFFVDILVKREANKRFGDAIQVPKLFDKWKTSLFPILLLGFGGALCLGPVLWILYFAFRKSGKWQPIGHPVPVQSQRGGDAYAGRTALLFLSLVPLQFVAEGLVQTFNLPEQTSSLLALVLAIASASFFIRLPLNGKTSSLRIVGFRSANPVQDILWGICGAIAAVPAYTILMSLVLLLQRVLPEAEHPIQAELASSTSSVGLLMLVLAASVGAPIFEELVFRGNLLPALQSLFRKPIWAVILCGSLFAMVHPTGIPVWPILASMGMVAACLTLQRGSLLPAITMHVVHNGAILMLGLVQI